MKDIYVVEIPFSDKESAMDFVDVLNLIVIDDDPTDLRAVLGYMTLNLLLKDTIVVLDNRATNCALTAEQVMTIAGKHQPDYCSDTHVCFDWQAIADELNSRVEMNYEDAFILLDELGAKVVDE